ncbi:aminopeptidase C [Hutsoniella sourekii]
MINQELLQEFHRRYQDNPANLAVESAIRSVGINQASLSYEVRQAHDFKFSDETERGAITNQKSSGRCWMFAALNTARVSTMEKLNLETFEFSQNYTLFWDKLEKSNFFLTSIIQTVEEDQDSRLVWHLLQKPCEDGGQWEMFAGLLNKYGSVPKEIMPETFHSSNTQVLNQVIETKLREFAARLRQMHQAGASLEELEAKRDEQLYFIYNVLVKALGQVPERFSYKYRDKDGEFHRIDDITPQAFFKEYTSMKTDKMVSLLNAPTEDKPYNQTYTVDYLGSIVESDPVKYLNVPIQDLKETAIKAIKNGYPVWFGSDVGKMSERKMGLLDNNMYRYQDTLGENFTLSKAERLDYSVSLLTHAMVLVGVDLDKDGKSLSWKVENSWGEDVGKDGIFSMSDEWFDEYTFQITVPSEYVSQELLADYQKEPVHLAPWDPMGSLAYVK